MKRVARKAGRNPRLEPEGLTPPPARVPQRLRTTADLRALQRLMTHALVRPLTAADELQARWRDGRRTAQVAAEFIKPNDRLSSFERLQIYARCYWYRLLEGMQQDCLALRAMLGEQRFSALATAYLARHPSRSFTMRNLCARLPQFIREFPRLTAPDTDLAHAIARFEWAQTVAFDGESRPVLTSDDIADVPPAKLRLALQPYLTLLALDWAIDDYLIALKKTDALRDDASNTMAGTRRGPRQRRLAPPRPGRIHVVVHRHQNRLYYKRIEAPAYRILMALAGGKTLAQAVAAAGGPVMPEQIRAWFATGMELGWFCRRRPA
jgi:hypothetical protein